MAHRNARLTMHDRRLVGRSSRPHRCPTGTSVEVEHRILPLRGSSRRTRCSWPADSVWSDQRSDESCAAITSLPCARPIRTPAPPCGSDTRIR